MKIITRKVYYCEHCKRHRLTAKAIETHEPKCIYNPGRSACGWHKDEQPNPPSGFVAELKDNLDLAALRTFASGCPACMLAVVVQADLHFEDRDDLEFAYEAEVKRFRDDEHHDAQMDEIRALESGWL